VTEGLTPGIDGRLYHLGVVVRDVDAAMDAYRSVLGVPAFHRIDTNYEARFRDWHGTIANRNAFGRLGDVMVELVEPGRGAGPAHYCLAARGEGVFHLGYMTDDPRQRPSGTEACFEVGSTRRPDGTYGIVYLETFDTLGYFVELVDRPMAEGLITLVDEAIGR
jgi:methylmalonyl-CoA/ethylmalonyl-CoA epimerase